MCMELDSDNGKSRNMIFADIASSDISTLAGWLADVVWCVLLILYTHAMPPYMYDE